MFRIVDIIAFTIERIRQHLLLVFWVLLGISIAVTLALSLPLYVDSVYSGILESRLSDPAYAYHFRYLGAWDGNISLGDSETISSVIEERYVELLGLPVEMGQRYMGAGRWNSRLSESNLALGSLTLGTLRGSDELMRITGGEWPASNDAEGRIPLLLPDTMLFANGVQVGDTLTIQAPGAEAVQAYVAAMWQPYNAHDPRWIFPPNQFFPQVMLVSQETFNGLIADMEDPIDQLGWYLILDGSALRTSEIDELLAASEAGQREIQLTLPETNMDASPNQGLKDFSNEVNQLVLQLFIIVLPVGGLVLYFVSLVAGLLVTRQQAEDVKLRSRGMSRSRVLAIHFLMWSFIVVAALAVAMALSPYLVALIGRTASFLDFSGETSVTGVVISTEAFLIALAAALIAASGGLLLAWRITQQNINSIKRISRNSEKAWWQRTYLDLLAIGLAAYTLYTLVTSEQSTESPFSDPITFMAPTLFALGLTLLFLRILPFIIGILARLMAVTSNIPILMALRELVRGIGRYRGTLLMTAFTLSLVGFTASMASSIDQSLVDVVQYRTGAELVIVTIPDAQTETVQDSDTGETSQEVTGFNAPPVQELLNLPEIESLSRMGRYDARMSAGNRRLTGLVLGIDRAGLGGSVFMRSDYSDVPLGNMLNLLADNRTGVIMSEKTAEENGILIGQEINYEVQVLGEWQSPIRATVVGFIEYFPTLNPADYEFFLISNITPIFETAGTALPFNVWVNVAEGVSLDEAKAAINATDFPVLRYQDPETLLLQEQAEPSRRGVLGFLSVGFIASIVLTLIGAVIQSTASFQEQMAQLGSLRAMGMSGFAVRLYIMVLQGLIAVSGVASGTLIGLGTTLLFLPYFDFGGGLPPYLVRVAWDEIAYVYGIFGAVLLLVAFLMAFVLSRQQLSRVVKLGSI